MKKLIILSAIVFGTLNGFAQNKTILSLSSGISLPLGDFASSSQNNPDAGLAKAGMHFDFSGSYRITKQLGVCGLVRYQFNPVNEDALKNSMNPADNPFPLTFELTTKPWKSYTYMLGLTGSVPVSQKLNWESKFMVGLSTVSSPDFDFSVNFMGMNESVSNKGKPSTYGSLLLGSGLRYRLNENWSLSGQIDYWLTEIKSTQKSSDGSIEESRGQYMNLSSLNIGVGIGYSC